MRAGFLHWFDWTAWRVLLHEAGELSAALTLSSSITIGPVHELPIGLDLTIRLLHETGPAIGLGLGLGLVQVECAIGRVVPLEEKPRGYVAKHTGQRGAPPFALLEGRWIWLKVARSW